MKFLVIILYIFVYSLQLISQDSKQITEKYFSDFDIDMKTPAFEKKRGFTEYDEMISYLNNIKSNYPDNFSYEYIGKSQKGKKIPMVFLGNPLNSNIKVCFMAGVHGNEPASTEGMLFLINNLLKEDSISHLLKNLNIAIIPMVNIDGCQKHSRYAANGKDLNRDFTKVTNPETRYLLKAINKFSPDVIVDFHEYKPYRADFVNFGDFGSTSLFDCMFLYSGNLNVCSQIKKTIEDLYLPNAKKSLDHYDLRYHNYLSSKNKDNKVYFNLGSVSPRSSATSFALGNNISILMEIRGVGLNRNSFKRRIFTTYLLAISFLETSSRNSVFVKSEINKCGTFPNDIVIKYSKEKTNYKLDMIDVYNNETISVDIFLHNGLKCNSKVKRQRPKYYIIESDLNIVVEKLKILGLEVESLKYDELLEVESYQVVSNRKSLDSFQGDHENIVNVELITENILFKKGTFIVSMAQKKSNLAVETLEPEMLSGFLRYNIIQPSEINKIHRYLLNKDL